MLPRIDQMVLRLLAVIMVTAYNDRTASPSALFVWRDAKLYNYEFTEIFINFGRRYASTLYDGIRSLVSLI